MKQQQEKGRHDFENWPSYFACILPPIRNRARALGYAVGVHGSMARDLDIIAVPWTENAVDAEVLVKALEEVTGAVAKNEEIVNKPHGRRCWVLWWPGEAPYIDLSVFPKNENSSFSTESIFQRTETGAGDL